VKGGESRRPNDMDRVLLDRTVALVRSGAMTEADGRSVSKALRAAIDSRPLAGAGKVEDTINLLGHAARSIVQLVSKLTDRNPEEICRKAGIPLLLAPSIKAGLDIDWSDPKQKALAVDVVERQVASLQAGSIATWTTLCPSRCALISRLSRKCAHKTWRSARMVRRASGKALRRIGASPSRTTRCATGARVAPSVSTATRSTSRETWSFQRSSPAP